MADTTEVISSCLNLMRRLPPKDIENSLAGLVNLRPEATDELLQRVDQPLQEAKDPETGRRYLRCEYNRDASSYRSPWSNKYDPPLEDGFTPGDRIRQMEVDANMLLDAYREVYYTGGVSSVYLWDLEDSAEEDVQDRAGPAAGSFAGCFLILKRVGGEGEGSAVGSWESFHVVQIELDRHDSKKATYKLNTTVMLSVAPAGEAAGATSLSGNLSRAKEESKTFSMDSDHLENVGMMIEAMENTVRSDMDGLYVQKTRQILSSMRSTRGASSASGLQSPFAAQLKGAIGQRGAKRGGGLADALNAKLGIS